MTEFDFTVSTAPGRVVVVGQSDDGTAHEVVVSHSHGRLYVSIGSDIDNLDVDLNDHTLISITDGEVEEA